MSNTIKNNNPYYAVKLNPDVMIGNKDVSIYNIHYYSDTEKRIVYGKLKYVDILYNIFEEPITNVTDLIIKNSSKVQNISIAYNEECIQIFNDGIGFNVDEGKYVVSHDGKNTYWAPEAALTLLNTGSNFTAKETGEISYSAGKNGLGIKMTFIFSQCVMIETANNGVKYEQILYLDPKSYMPVCQEPIITKQIDIYNYTKLTFFPDKELGSILDIAPLIKRRAIETSMIFSINSISVNDTVYPNITSLADFVKTYLDSSIKEVIEYKTGVEWRICVWHNKDKNKTMTFVNGMYTPENGTHLNIVRRKVSEQIAEYMNAHNLYGKKIVADWKKIKTLLSFVIVVFVSHPTFSGQTKNKLNTTTAKLPKFEGLPENLIKIIIPSLKIAMEEYIRSLKITELNKEHGKKQWFNIKYYVPSENSKNRKEKESYLILTEGKSADGAASQGLSILGEDGRRIFGRLRLGGKVINALKHKFDKIAENKYIKNMVAAIGLRYGVDYTITNNFNTLKYNKIYIFTDADQDGTHISGLICVFILVYWPELLRSKGFINIIRSPCVRILKLHNNKYSVLNSFYSLEHFNKYMETNKLPNGVQVSYYKGIGSNNPEELLTIFGQLTDNTVRIYYKSENCVSSMHTVFGTDSILRKEWYYRYVKLNINDIVSYDSNDLSLEELNDKNMYAYANYDIMRSIPCIVDGLKPVQRKLLYTFLHKKIYGKVKVNSVCGKATTLTCYSHGDSSIQLTLCRMAQRITGVNNINLFRPEGYLGQRESLAPAQARYAQIMLESYTRLIYREEDNPILTHVLMEGVSVEYKHYIPIVPMILINGCDGIGTGFSTKIPKYNVDDIINKIMCRLNKKEEPVIQPWYINYAANHLITKLVTYETKYIDYSDNNVVKDIKYETYESLGLVDLSQINIDKTIIIYDLPLPGLTYEKYFDYLKELLNDGILLDVRQGTSKNEFMNPLIITLSDSYYSELIKIYTSGGDYILILISKLKLKRHIHTSNLILIDHENKLKKYTTISEIFDAYYNLRYDMYIKRKEYYIQKMINDLLLLYIKIIFIGLVCDGKIIIKNISIMDLIFAIDNLIPEARKILIIGSYTENSDGTITLNKKAYSCLTQLRMKELTTNSKEKLNAKYNLLLKQLEEYKLLTIEQIWISELNILKKSLDVEYGKK